MPQEHDLVENLQESPPNYKLFKELDLTSRCCALHTIRVETTVVSVDKNLDSVRNKLSAQLEQSAAYHERLARDAAERADHQRQSERAAEELRGRRTARGADSGGCEGLL